VIQLFFMKKSIKSSIDPSALILAFSSTLYCNVPNLGVFPEGSVRRSVRWIGSLLAAVAIAQPAAQAQTSYPLTSGGYLGASVVTTPETYNAGYTFYSAAWPLMGNYARDNAVQTGLYGTWMWPSKSIPNDHYTTIEGGLGWWYGRSFQTATPKFIMGGVGE
jgi:hypothetical protein